MIARRAQKNKNAENDVVSAGILTSLLISLPITICLFAFKDKLTFIFADPRAYDILIIILPGVVITSVYAVIRGYFWGNRDYLSYSLIELIEEIAMAVVGVILISKATDFFDGAKKAGTAVFVSYTISFTLSSLVFVLKHGRLSNPVKELKPLIQSSSPITAMRTITAALSSLISIILPLRLVAFGMTTSQALSSFGEVSGMALPLLFIPSTVIGSIALVIVPEISENYYAGDISKLTQNAQKTFTSCLVFSSLIIPVFIGLGREICLFIYSNENVGLYLSLSAIIMLPMSVSMITNSLLNSINKERLTLLNYVLSAVLMLLCIYFLTAVIGILSLLVGYLLSYTLTSILNVRLLNKCCNNKFRYKRNLLFCFLSIIPSATFSLLLSNLLVRVTTTFLTIVISCVLTLIFSVLLLFIFGVLTVDEFKNFKLLKKSNQNA